jgi:hypothetical protein
VVYCVCLHHDIGLGEDVALENGVRADGNCTCHRPDDVLRKCAADEGDLHVSCLHKGSGNLENPS